jgi:hypothetical protein
MTEAGRDTPRGFDSYRISLGDELRGERASMGKSLLDVQRELRIKASHIDAIENADPDAIPYASFVTGYVRAYARYLSLDEELVLRRFCDETGFDPGGRAAGAPVARAATRKPARRRGGDDIDALFAGSRLAAASRAAHYNASLGATLRTAGSVAVMASLVAGLGYGAWSVLENIQRVGFAPSPDAPRALIAPPALGSAPLIAQAGVAPTAIIDTAALSAVYAAQETPPPAFEPSDGPISALDPSRSGVYAREEAAQAAAARPVPIDPPLQMALAALRSVEADDGASGGDGSAESGAARRAEPVDDGRVALVVRDEAWVRVRDGAGSVAHEALMPAGGEWVAPADVQGLTLRAGNAGGVYLRVGGALYGPLGRPGGVVSNIVLDAESVKAVFPRADAPAQGAGDSASPGAESAALAQR